MEFANSSLVVLMVFFVGFCFGLIIGGLNRGAKRAEAAERHVEHESDAPYPKLWD